MRVIFIILQVLFYLQTPAQVRFKITSADIQSPVFVQLKKPLPVAGRYELLNESTKKTIAAQLLDSLTIVFMPEKIQPGKNISYTLRPSSGAVKPPPVTVEKLEKGLLVKVENKPLFFYHTKEAIPPPDSPSYYRRSGFIHPLYSPSGKILTDDFPVGHAHQHGIFFSWTSTTFKQSSVDFWNPHQKKGTVEHIDVVEVTEGPVATRIKTSLRYVSFQHGEVLREIWTLTIYPVLDHYIFDLESQQQNITVDTLYLNKYHYGGMAFRGSSQFNSHDAKNFKDNWNVLTSEGIKDSSANATRARWVDISGRIDNSVAGATVFNHPQNFRYPQSIRVHPQMPYWSYAPVVDSGFVIPPGGYYRSKFRYFVHDGQVSPQLIESYFRQWTLSAIKPD